MIRLKVLIGGRVQGVGFRFFTKENGEKFNCSGWVKNLPDGRVEAEIQGDEENVARLLELLRKGPGMGFVNDFNSQHLPIIEDETKFKISY